MKCLSWNASVIAVCLGVFSLLFSSHSLAGHRAGAGSFTLGAGYYHFAPKRHVGNTGVKFGELGYDFNEHWGIEGLLGFYVTDSHQPQIYGRSVNGTIFAINGIYRFCTYYHIQPYVLLGPGAISMHPNANDANTEGNINGGIGAQYFFHPSIALRAEARDFYTFVGGKNDYFLNGGVSFLVR